MYLWFLCNITSCKAFLFLWNLTSTSASWSCILTQVLPLTPSIAVQAPVVGGEASMLRSPPSRALQAPPATGSSDEETTEDFSPAISILKTTVAVPNVSMEASRVEISPGLKVKRSKPKVKQPQVWQSTSFYQPPAAWSSKG